MSKSTFISPNVIESFKHESDPDAIAIKEQEESIEISEKNIAMQKADLQYRKEKRAKQIVIKWRESILWCLDVDDNPEFFLKTALALSECVAYKNAIDVNADIKLKIGTTLSIMHRIGKIGRISFRNSSYYGLAKYFNEDLQTLKPEYEKNLKKLR